MDHIGTYHLKLGADVDGLVFAGGVGKHRTANEMTKVNFIVHMCTGD